MSAPITPGLVHDYLLVMRGAERTFAALAACWPDAPIHTLLYDPVGTNGRFVGRDVRPSPLQRLHVGQRGFRRLLPLFPLAAQRLPVADHDVVISSSSAFAHGVRPAGGALHVCYCHSPFRYAWHERATALRESPRVLRPLLARTLDGIRRWDERASRRVTHYVANSQITRRRIAEFWDRDATIVHPPVDTDRFAIGVPEDFFLVVTELVSHKRVEVALRAAERAHVPVKVVGTGPELERLRTLHSRGVEFLGRISDEELATLYGRSRALIVPNVEEFGIAAVESQAAGRPVVGIDEGGTRETVVDGRTGVLVKAGDVDALAEALRETHFDRFRPQDARAQAERFCRQAFQHRMIAEVARACGD
ncbi:MAG: Glycosyltransferase [uncultured Solirubrobacteraceae bacterium]|uniref:Glycosyltransferase n=1 Tax=uncultured Solirubrobacteraceae bacterium TaxID=1162706 RepID=A0A6J4RRY2_9ACTN|nr:MAG: Glycosyltransferase [uncultured Solirubrobacteraceae bacterium]